MLSKSKSCYGLCSTLFIAVSQLPVVRSEHAAMRIKAHLDNTLSSISAPCGQIWAVLQSLSSQELQLVILFSIKIPCPGYRREREDRQAAGREGRLSGGRWQQSTSGLSALFCHWSSQCKIFITVEIRDLDEGSLCLYGIRAPIIRPFHAWKPTIPYL